MIEHLEAAADREAAGPCTFRQSMACSCSFYRSWLSTLKGFQAWADGILRMMEDHLAENSVTLKSVSMADLWRVIPVGMFSEFWLVGSVSPPLILSVKPVVAVQVLTAGSSVGYASSPFSALVVSVQVLIVECTGDLGFARPGAAQGSGVSAQVLAAESAVGPDFDLAGSVKDSALPEQVSFLELELAPCLEEAVSLEQDLALGLPPAGCLELALGLEWESALLRAPVALERVLAVLAGKPALGLPGMVVVAAFEPYVGASGKFFAEVNQTSAALDSTVVEPVEVPAGLAVRLAVEALLTAAEVDVALVVADILAALAGFEMMLFVGILVPVAEIALVLGPLVISEVPLTKILVSGIPDLWLAS